MFKNLIKFLLAFNILTFASSSITSCEPIKTFPSVSAQSNIETLNQLFIGQEIEPVYINYLKYINGFFEHSGFEDALSTNKITTSLIDTDKLNETELKYYNSLKNIYQPVQNENILDFSGMTFIVENIFIDEFGFVKNDTKKETREENVSDQDLKSYVNTTMAITVLKGWKTVGRLLLQVKMDEKDYFLRDTSFQFINKWLESSYSLISVNKKDKHGWYTYSNYEINEDNVETFKKDIISKANRLKNFEIKNNEISLWSEKLNEEDKNGQIKEVTYNGFELKGQRYTFKQ
ncbi:hypothetical protein [Spiroplasma tabanidicola]|uniref:Lipoprotein n=1 Tax=Spiroplasma tabanidicola TaxID=324079 RepID=A0A6I6CAG6_9MOLU|nr:hypothetical protein [Spiroplasma tabanidicola]QGS51921.1 hypothetical protein STABA_v1c05580 [Spiroplasma tabanidicola]